MPLRYLTREELNLMLFITDDLRLEKEKMAKIKVKQVKSAINRPSRQKKTLEALGLRKLNQVVEHEATPQIVGMIKKVSHMVEVLEK